MPNFSVVGSRSDSKEFEVSLETAERCLILLFFPMGSTCRSCIREMLAFTRRPTGSTVQ